MPFLPRCLGWSFLALASASGPLLGAAEGEGPEPVRYGFRILGAKPVQDFKLIEPSAGVGLGLFADQELGPSLRLQTRADYLRYPETARASVASIGAYALPNTRTLAADSVAVGADLQRRLSPAGPDGCYVLAGLFAARFEFRTEVPTSPAANAPTSLYKEKTKFKLGGALGVGYDFGEHLGVALRYTAGSYDGVTLATLEGSFSYRF